MTTTKSAKPRGFAAMKDKSALKEIARKGGKQAHVQGTAHTWNSDTARIAGKKGGVATHARKKAAKLVQPATVSGAVDPKDPNRDVRVNCSSAAGCEGIAKAKDAGGDYVGELPTKKGKGANTTPKPTSDDQAVKDGSSADEDPSEMGSCGGSGCGSH